MSFQLDCFDDSFQLISLSRNKNRPNSNKRVLRPNIGKSKLLLQKAVLRPNTNKLRTFK